MSTKMSNLKKTEYFEYITTVLKAILFYIINLSAINNVILQEKDDILQENCRISGHGIAGHYSKLSDYGNRAMAHFYG